jgi:L-ascorbate metabolism protein UlaG (beta-lactamase superfamily)
MRLSAGTAASLLAGLILSSATLVKPQPAGNGASSASQPGVRGQYLGVAGWEITDGKTVVLIDPYISRLSGPPGDGSPTPPGWPGKLTFQDLAVPDTAAVDRHIGRADYILITHAHYVHLLDAPYIARTRKAILIGNESAANIARAYGVPDDQIITIRGGEDLDFGSFSVRVIPSLHTLGHGPRALSAVADPNATKGPLPFSEFVDGGTVGFLISLGGLQILAFGSMNYIEREISGLRPDVVLVPSAPPRREIYDYTGRLLRTLGLPRLVIATHWDSSQLPYGANFDRQLKDADDFKTEVHAVSPQSRVVIPPHFEWISLSANGEGH